MTDAERLSHWDWLLLAVLAGWLVYVWAVVMVKAPTAEADRPAATQSIPDPE